jgi:hypothetical protein
MSVPSCTQDESLLLLPGSIRSQASIVGLQAKDNLKTAVGAVKHM